MDISVFKMELLIQNQIEHTEAIREINVSGDSYEKDRKIEKEVKDSQLFEEEIVLVFVSETNEGDWYHIYHAEKIGWLLGTVMVQTLGMIVKKDN